MLGSLFNNATLLKRVTNTGVSCEYCEIFKNIYFEEHLRTAASKDRYLLAPNIKILMVLCFRCHWSCYGHLWKVSLENYRHLENKRVINSVCREAVECCKKDGFRNFTKFTKKHLCQSFFFNKLTASDLQLY